MYIDISHFSILKLFDISFLLLWSFPLTGWVFLTLLLVSGFLEEVWGTLLVAFLLSLESSLLSLLNLWVLSLLLSMLKRLVNHLWLESDSTLAYLDISFRRLFPCSIRNRWNKCLSCCKILSLKFLVFLERTTPMLINVFLYG